MNLLRALVTVSGLTFVSRILGFARDFIIARAFGAGLATDAFFVAFRLPNLLRRLFAEDDVRMFESAPVFFRCRCSRERVTTMLKALGQAEIAGLLAERGLVEVRCEFCSRAYHFDAVDVEALFLAGTVQVPRGGPAH